MRENSPPYCCNCLLRARTGVRSGVVTQEEEDFIYLPVRPNRSNSLFNVCTFRSELAMAPLSKNSTNVILSLSQKTLAMTLPAKFYTLNFFLRNDEWLCLDVRGSVHHSKIHKEKSNKTQQRIKNFYSIFT
jgi:hypothetical protein